jgi:hypothetical protein
MQEIRINKKIDLETVFGKKVTETVLSFRNASMKRLPTRVEIRADKPEFHLNDGSILRAYGVDLETGEVVKEHYCGSGDSAINHPEQFTTGQVKLPTNKALMFVECYWNGRNMSWTLTVVSQSVTSQLEG